MKLNKKQKRTATIASMAALLAVVLGMGGQTFAKYIETTTTQAGNVTIAKWGVVANIKDYDNKTDADAKLFKTSYTGVESSTSNAVVAPGTKGSIETIVTGQPEVSAEVKYTFSLDDVSVTRTEGTEKTYYPITWKLTINGASSTHNGKNAMTEINAKITPLNKVYEPNQNFEEVSVKIEWSWEFDGSAASTFENVSTSTAGDFYTNNDMDSLLGDAAAEDPTATSYTVNYNSTDYTYTVDCQLSYQFGVSIEQVQA